MKINRGEHVFVAGRTGSGKTELEKIYLAGYEDVLILDTKGTFSWKQIKDVHIFTSLKDLTENYEFGKAIYRPNINEMCDEFYDAFFKFAYFRKNITVGIDEVMSICENASNIPFYYKACLTRGRELLVDVWSCTQRPKTIPLVTMSESSHFFIFDLNIPDDRKRISDATGLKEFETLPSKVGGKHSFMYYNFEMDTPVVGKLNIK